MSSRGFQADTSATRAAASNVWRRRARYPGNASGMRCSSGTSLESARSTSLEILAQPPPPMQGRWVGRQCRIASNASRNSLLIEEREEEQGRACRGAMRSAPGDIAVRRTNSAAKLPKSEMLTWERLVCVWPARESFAPNSRHISSPTQGNTVFLLRMH